MPFMNIFWQERTAIINASHMAIVYGMLDTWDRCRKLGNKPEEPDFVAGLVLESVPLLYYSLRTILQPYKIDISLASIFCHQRPIVKYNGAVKSCELGDLMFVHIHTNIAKTVRRNALLYQAKKSSKHPYVIQSNEQHQLTLYTDWPMITYVSPKPLAGKTRDVEPKMPHSGAQYMLIDDRPPDDPRSGLQWLPNTYPIGSCMADKYLHNHNHLAAELLDFMRFHSGKAFEEKTSMKPTDGWSHLVWDLIDTGLKKGFNRKNSGISNSPRYSGGPIFLLDGSSFAMATNMSAASIVTHILGEDRANKFFSLSIHQKQKNDLPKDENNEPESGVSIILIETEETNSSE